MLVFHALPGTRALPLKVFAGTLIHEALALLISIRGMVVALADRSEDGAVGGKSPSGELDVTVGKAGVGAAMMQMNRRTSTASAREQDDGLGVTVGKAGVGAAMMQMNRRTSTQRGAGSTGDA